MPSGGDVGSMGSVSLGPVRRTVPAASLTGERAFTGGYLGDDRRGLLHDERATGRAWQVAAALTVTTIAILIVARRAPVGFDPAILRAQLAAAAFVLTIPLATLCLVRWRLVGEAALLWLGLAAATHGLLTMGVGQVLADSFPIADPTTAGLATAGRLVSLGLVAAAWHAPEIDTRLRPWRLTFGVSVAVVALGGLAVGLERSGVVSLPPPSEAWPSGWAVGAAWLGLAGWALRIGLHRRRQLLTWFALAFSAFGAAELSEAVPAVAGSVGELAPALLQVMGLAVGIAGAVSGVDNAFARQNRRLLSAVNAELAAESRIAAEDAAQRERVHEARNALTAIELATLALQVEGAGGDRRALSDGVAAELRRLAQLIDPPQAPSALVPFHLIDATVGLAVPLRGSGTQLRVDVPDHLVAIGRTAQVTQVLHNLLQNARRYGGRTVAIRAAQEGSDVVLRVVDDGPGIPPGDRERVFDRGVRGMTAAGTDGDGLGLHIARRLMVEQGGSLELEDPPQRGGACFAVRLPAVAASAEEGVDELEQPREVGVGR